jgi:hypothetical protein
MGVCDHLYTEPSGLYFKLPCLLSVHGSRASKEILYFAFNADPDPAAFHLNPDPDPASHQSDVNLRPLVYRPFRAPF